MSQEVPCQDTPPRHHFKPFLILLDDMLLVESGIDVRIFVVLHHDSKVAH